LPSGYEAPVFKGCFHGVQVDNKHTHNNTVHVAVHNSITAVIEAARQANSLQWPSVRSFGGSGQRWMAKLSDQEMQG